MKGTSLDSPCDVTDDYEVAEDVIPDFSFNVVAGFVTGMYVATSLYYSKTKYPK